MSYMPSDRLNFLSILQVKKSELIRDLATESQTVNETLFAIILRNVTKSTIFVLF